jgi:Putative beta-barrel porin 2
MNPRIFRILAAAALWALAGAGLASAGQATTVSDTVPPGTLTLGPVRITPSLLLNDLGIDDNVFNSATDRKRDFTFTITPRADVLFRMRRLKASFNTATDYVYYQTYKSERGTNTASGGRVDVDLGRLKPYASIQGVDTKSRLNGEVDTRARHHDLLYGAGVAFRIASRTHVVFNGVQGKVAYDPGQEFRGVDLRQSFNGRRRNLDGGLTVALTPLTTFAMIVAREDQRFELSPDRNSNSWRVSPTFTFSPTGVLTGNASVGYRRFTPLSPALPSYAGLVSTVGIGATIYSRHQMQAVFSRDVQYSYDLDNDYYIGTGGTVTWTWLLFGPIDVRGIAGRFLMDYRGGPLVASDTNTSYGGGVGYRFSNKARLGANFNVVRRESKNSPDRSFRNQRFFVGLTWGLTS